jgi:hypothetical protein
MDQAGNHAQELVPTAADCRRYDNFVERSGSFADAA